MQTKAELKEEAEKLGIELDPKATKADIIEAIELHNWKDPEEDKEDWGEPEVEEKPKNEPAHGDECSPVDILTDQPGSHPNYPPPLENPPNIPPGLEGTHTIAENLDPAVPPPEQDINRIEGVMEITPELTPWKMEPGEEEFLKTNVWLKGEFALYTYYRTLSYVPLMESVKALAGLLNPNTGWHTWQYAQAISGIYSGRNRPPEAQANTGVCHPNIGPQQLPVQAAKATDIMKPANLVPVERDETTADVPTAPPQVPRPMQDTPELRKIQGVGVVEADKDEV